MKNILLLCACLAAIAAFAQLPTPTPSPTPTPIPIAAPTPVSVIPPLPPIVLTPAQNQAFISAVISNLVSQNVITISGTLPTPSCLIMQLIRTGSNAGGAIVNVRFQ